MMKQLPLSLAIVAAIALSACGGSSSPDEAPKDPKSPTIPSQAAQPTQQTSAENTAETPTKQEPTATPQKPATIPATTASSSGRGGSSYAGSGAGSTSSASTDQTKDKEQTVKTDETPKGETPKTDETQESQDETTQTDETQEGQDETTKTDEGNENPNPAPEQPAEQLTQAEFEALNAKFSKRNLLSLRKSGTGDPKIKSQKVAPDGENVLTFKEIEETLNGDLQYAFMFKPEANKGFVSKEETYGQYSITADKNGQTETRKHFLSQKFSYSRFGKRITSIQTGADPAQNSYDFYSYGDLTPLTKEKGNVLTGQANYVGNAYLDTVASTPADKKSYITDFKAEVDFDKNSLEGTFLNFRQYDSQSLFSDGLADNFGRIAKKDISDSEIDDAAKTFTSTIRGNTFRTVSDAKEVVVNGRFYGADGEEIGGIINTDKIQGAFGGKKAEAEAASEQ